MKYVIYKDAAGFWRWTFTATNGRVIAVSSESYHNKTDCQASITLVKSSANAPVFEA